MPQRDGPRLAGRNGEVWRRYIEGQTQARIGDDLGLSQQRVSEVLAEVRAGIPDDARTDAALVDLERLDVLLTGVMPAAVAGDTQATRAALAVLERRARMLRLDLDEPLKISFERHLDDQGQLLADAIGAVLDALDLTHEQRVFALGVAQSKLLGEEIPPASPRASVEEPKPDLMSDFRRFAEQEGFDPDGLDDGEDDDDDDE